MSFTHKAYIIAFVPNTDSKAFSRAKKSGVGGIFLILLLETNMLWTFVVHMFFRIFKVIIVQFPNEK